MKVADFESALATTDAQLKNLPQLQGLTRDARVAEIQRLLDTLKPAELRKLLGLYVEKVKPVKTPLPDPFGTDDRVGEVKTLELYDLLWEGRKFSRETLKTVRQAVGPERFGNALKALLQIAEAMDKQDIGTANPEKRRAHTNADLERILAQIDWQTDSYRIPQLLADLVVLTDARGFRTAVRNLKQTANDNGPGVVLGKRFQIEFAARRARAGSKKIVFEEKVEGQWRPDSNGEPKDDSTDIDVVIDGIRYQAKRTAGAFGNATDVRRWVEIVHSSGVSYDKMRYVTREGETVSPTIMQYLAQLRINIEYVP